MQWQISQEFSKNQAKRPPFLENKQCQETIASHIGEVPETSYISMISFYNIFLEEDVMR